MKKVFIISGAGLSAESGLRTFRDSDGLWEEHDVMEVCSVEGWQRDRVKVSGFYNLRREQLKSAEPNEAHFALARIEKKYRGRVWNLTQNVDDLLERAGCQDVIHLHGTLRDLRCEKCKTIWDIFYGSQEGEICPKCRTSDVRHNVVMFGEPAPMYSYIHKALIESGLFVAIGTSGAVIDIANLADKSKKSILLNPKRESYAWGGYIDDYFDLFIQKNATDGAKELEEEIDRFMS